MVVPLQNVAVSGGMQVLDHALVLCGERCGGKEGLLPRFVAVRAFGETLDLCFKHIFGQSVNIGVIIVKGIPRDLASLRDVADGDLVKGTLCQELDEAAADGVFGAQGHRWIPLFLNWCKIIISDAEKTCKGQKTEFLTESKHRRAAFMPETWSARRECENFVRYAHFATFSFFALRI